MRCFLFLTTSLGFLLLAGCEEGEGTQIGNEGIIATDPSETGCTARALSGDHTFDGWPSTLGDATELLMSNLGDVQLVADGVITEGTLAPAVQGYRLVEGDCEHVHVDLDLRVEFDGVLESRTRGDLLIDIERPTERVTGELSSSQWSGSLLPTPSSQRTLFLDVTIDRTDFSMDVVLETCLEPDSCTEDSYGVIEPL